MTDQFNIAEALGKLDFVSDRYLDLIGDKWLSFWILENGDTIVYDVSSYIPKMLLTH